MLALFCALALADPWAEVAETAEMSVPEVKALLSGVEKRQSVLDRMARPWEAQPWHRYSALFLTEDRLADGLVFWKTHEDTLARVSRETGVPAEIIVAIVGVETRWGQHMGDDPVIESLFTLGMYHPKRGGFFRKELGHYLRLATDEGWALPEVKGSYAGAMGMGQFIPSSYVDYARDGDGDGKRDLFSSEEDVIASVANYFVAHGWRASEPVLIPVSGDPAALDAHLGPGLELDRTVASLSGATPATELAPDTPVKLFRFELAEGAEYRLGLHNFYVITRYNRSPLYARVVWELATQLRDGR